MNLKQVGDVVIALGQALKAGSIPVTLASDQGTIPVLDTNSAASKADLDILAGIISANKAAVKAAAGDFADLATLAAIVSGSKAAIKSATNDIVDIATLLARHTDNFGSSTAITAATTFGAIPLVATLAASSFATLTNASYQDTFTADHRTASGDFRWLSFSPGFGRIRLAQGSEDFYDRIFNRF